MQNSRQLRSLVWGPLCRRKRYLSSGNMSCARRLQAWRCVISDVPRHPPFGLPCKSTSVNYAISTETKQPCGLPRSAGNRTYPIPLALASFHHQATAPFRWNIDDEITTGAHLFCTVVGVKRSHSPSSTKIPATVGSGGSYPDQNLRIPIPVCRREEAGGFHSYGPDGYMVRKSLFETTQQYHYPNRALLKGEFEFDAPSTCVALGYEGCVLFFSELKRKIGTGFHSFTRPSTRNSPSPGRTLLSSSSTSRGG